MFEVLLGYDEEAKNSYHIIGLCSKDTARKMDLVAVNDANDRPKARIQYIKEDKLVEVSGLFHYHLHYHLTSSFEQRLLKDKPSTTERQFYNDG